MIVKILPPSATFKGVRYNTDKVDRDKGELVKVSGFGALEALDNLRPKDYINYLEAQSSASKRTHYPQFHAVISCKGRSHSKEQLADIAEKWLEGMGYGNQPYLLVFHKDTKNNHIHIVSTRVDKGGRKINDSYEKLRAYQVLNRVMGLDEHQAADQAIQKALAYSFATHAQFMLLLEARGYSLTAENDMYKVCRYGKEQAKVPLEKVDSRIAVYRKGTGRLTQLRAITEKYRATHDATIVPLAEPLPGGGVKNRQGYTSGLAELLAEKFGVQVVFHGKPGKPPYGYTVIDHARKAVYKGGDLMPLAEFGRSPGGILPKREPQAALGQGKIWHTPDPEPETNALSVETMPYPEINQRTDLTEAVHFSEGLPLPGVHLDIADDIDDEAILGRNRRRKRKARTNTR